MHDREGTLTSMNTNIKSLIIINSKVSMYILGYQCNY